MRTARDFEAALEAGFSGYLSIAVDAMRDVLEATDLVLMFSTDIKLVDAWLGMPPDDNRKFSPQKVRGRLHNKGVKYKENSWATSDYKGHSRALHVNPWWELVGEKGMYPRETPLFRDVHFWEIFGHARELVYALDRLRDQCEFDWPEVSRAEDLGDVAQAYALTHHRETIMLTVLETYRPSSWRDLAVVIKAAFSDYAERNSERPSKAIWRDST